MKAWTWLGRLRIPLVASPEPRWSDLPPTIQQELIEAAQEILQMASEGDEPRVYEGEERDAA